jgi:hypothetical protein
MDSTRWRDQYLAKAKDAEARAAQATDELDKAAWLRIAAGYHDLAGRLKDREPQK